MKVIIIIYYTVCAGQQIPYSEIHDRIVEYNAIIRWDMLQLSPYFDHQMDGKDYQVSHMTAWLDHHDHIH